MDKERRVHPKHSHLTTSLTQRNVARNLRTHYTSVIKLEEQCHLAGQKAVNYAMEGRSIRNHAEKYTMV
jgi:hypothetical protein